ncbi:MAG: spermidine/putrescine ABC transporter substrate-binding protein [Solirubrobacterales bacterium]|nr:spermidine/putrescine ABC transporter substrate-binding protein [Solirubrobacterales bacterium]MCB8916256.1 spermidine/putrescine ABC transporter substrate-binding protein [Thermoleophilales bacterium]
MTNIKMKQIRLLALGVLALVASLVLVACGGGGGGLGGSDNSDVTTASGGDPKGSLKISNWPLYIDGATIKNFDKVTGTSTTYTEDVNSNTDFFGKMQPLLSQGDSGGRSIIVVTDWMAEKMFKLGYIQKLDKAKIPNVEKNLIPALQSPSFDPNREFSVPWQSGMTGLVVRKDLAPDVKSINDLWDPKYKGKVTVLDEMRDTIPLMMAADGIDPVDATDQDWLDTIDKFKGLVSSGQIRKVTGNDYIQDLANGNVVAAIGWSGDAIQAQADNENIAYVQPAQGCSIWSDNMLIPVGAPNAAAAYEFMNYVYEPEVQAKITQYVNYVSPVEGVKQILLKQDPALANNELIFPSEQFTAKCFNQVSPPGDEQQVQEVEQAFEDAKLG